MTWRRIGEWRYSYKRKSPQYPLDRRLGGGEPEPVWTQWWEKFPAPTGIRTPPLPIIQPVAQRYTDWAIPAPEIADNSRRNVLGTVQSSLMCICYPMCTFRKQVSHKDGYVNRNCHTNTESRRPLGPTQPPIQWVPEALSLGGKASGAWSWPFTSF
jgi:hypothetical protein